MNKSLVIPVLLAVFCLWSASDAYAQFKEKAFTQNYNDHKDTLSRSDTSDKVVNFKEIFGGLAHKRSMRIGSMFGTSIFLPGTAQIYNKEYWKLPVFYGGMAAGITTGCIYNNKFKNSGLEQDRQIMMWSFIGAGVFYYASLMDGVVSYKSDKDPLPGRATIYSILLPGLGQIYNKEYWKLPIYWGGMVGAAHFWAVNQKNFIRFRDIYRESVEPGYSGPISSEQAKYYRNTYRRYRDYSIVAFGLVYLLQIIDANVFCYMHDFNVSDDLEVNLSPTVIMPPENSYAMMQPAAGMSLGLRF